MELNLLNVSSNYHQMIDANRAEISVRIKGSSVISNATALEKAKEVRQLVEALTNYGLAKTAIQLQSVVAEVNNGMLLRSSSATYSLLIRCDDLEQLPDLLGIITSQKQVSLENVTWGFPDDQAMINTWLQAALELAKAKAKAMAQTLGVQIIGVHRVDDHYHSEQQTYAPQALFRKSAAAPRAAAPSFTKDDLGLAMVHRKRIEVQVQVAFIINQNENFSI
ncbi:SIMPL domain-containing protein [Herpetosiphon llansteffanensis]|uniref:SIMPL domain-containing protein n=1 Tax=Herpetosiphon llansteffanensis TaxID=2094568 RepID=UPI000D7BDCEC|nr:SIMPL domain-containing protein [Herpetosiphon llansteffanensis]